MKTIVLLGAAVVAGAARYPTEGPIPVRDDDEADRLVEMKLAKFADDDGDEADDDLKDLSVADLKTLAEKEKADLGEATKKADIIAAIRAHRARAAA